MLTRTDSFGTRRPVPRWWTVVAHLPLIVPVVALIAEVIR